MSKERSVKGIVDLVGAGPGATELLTLGAKRCIEQAQVILYDGLINEEILGYAPSDCQKICVGKRGNGGAWTQSQIDDLIVQCAGRYERVVRLKGGDTAVFARTSEEIDRLEAEGIRYRIVPGLTAALAVSAYAGIPLTHRDWSSGVALVAAQLQNQDGESEAEDQLDWEALARFPGTLVMYMSIGSAGAWSQKLIVAGKSPSTPVALVRKCTWPEQEVLECELATVSQTLSENPRFAPPVISVIGPLVRYKASMSMKISTHSSEVLVTSPETQSKRLAAMLESMGVSTMIKPALNIEPGRFDSIDQAIDRLDQTDWIVFSSRYGVESFCKRLHQRGLDARRFGSTRIAVVGKSTADALMDYGLKADCVAGLNPYVVNPNQGDSIGGQGAESLLEHWLGLAHGQRIILVKNPDGKQTIQDQLKGVASEVRTVDAYVQVPVEQWTDLEQVGIRIQSSLARGTKLWVTATSSNIARSSWRLLGEHAQSVRWVAISEAVALVLQELGASDVIVSAEASYESLCQAIVADRQSGGKDR